MREQKIYYKFSQYLREHFGARVYKVGVDAGFSCPNRDGRISKDGCIYCDNRAFSYNTRIGAKPVTEQIERGMKFGRERYGAEKFIVYFQAYTNTYAPVAVLKETYDTIKQFQNIVGIAIGTRPDFVNEEILDLIQSYAGDYEVWLEYGLQSVHQKTLEVINRNHTYEDFLKAYELTKKRNIKICAHLIIGLPEEGKSEIVETAKEMGRLKLDGIKIHPLHIIKGTKLEELFERGLYRPLELEDYVDILKEFLNYLWPGTIIQRITADCSREFLVAPEWILDKNRLLNLIEIEIGGHNTYFFKK